MREGVLHEEREIILGLDASPEVRAELLAVAFTIGACYFPGEVHRIEQEGPDWCEEMIVRTATAQSLEELGL